MANILVIEDEPIIAIDIVSLVEGLGHEVIGVARTKDEAVSYAKETRPDLILADVQLADNSNGIDAVGAIGIDSPVIFITAFPERLITGHIGENTYLLAKPFQVDTVRDIISKALSD